MDDNHTNSAFASEQLRLLPVLAGQSGNTGCQAAIDVASMGLFLGLATLFVR